MKHENKKVISINLENVKASKRKELHSRFKVYGYTGSDCCGGFPAHDGYVTKGEAEKIRASLCLRGFRFEGKGGWRGWIEETQTWID